MRCGCGNLGALMLLLSAAVESQATTWRARLTLALQHGLVQR